jgi:type I restriction-modification system DNA methylase subunit
MLAHKFDAAMGIDVPSNVCHDNTSGESLYGLGGPRDKVDLIITNPPFGGMEEMVLNEDFRKTLIRPRETADLFMVLIMICWKWMVDDRRWCCRMVLFGKG